MRNLTWIVLCTVGMCFAATACSDDSEDVSQTGGSGGAAAGSGGSAGKAGATNNGGSAGKAGASGGGGSTFPIQCPGGTPVCDATDNTAWTCTEFGPTMTPCGNTECKGGKCTCSSDEQCKVENDKSWVECGCTDGQTVKKTTNEIAACDTASGACVEYKMDTICKAVCKDNGGDGELTDMHVEL